MVEALDGAQLLAICMLTLLGGGLAWQFLRSRQGESVVSYAAERGPSRIRHLLTLEDAFDPERAALWEAQIPALQLIQSGVAAAKLLLFFARYPKRFPELFEGTSFEEWLQFLKSCNLVRVAQGEIRLTPEGVEFLNSLRPTPALSGAAAAGAGGRSRAVR